MGKRSLLKNKLLRIAGREAMDIQTFSDAPPRSDLSQASY